PHVAAPLRRRPPSAVAVPLQVWRDGRRSIGSAGLRAGRAANGGQGDDEKEDDVMAEIRIEQKKGSLAWLWILLLVLVVAAAAWYMTTSRVVPATTAAPPADSTVAPAAAPLPPARVDSVSLPMTSAANRMRLLNA